MGNKEKFVFLGDSLTFGYNVTNGEDWVSLVTKKLAVSSVNKGVNGDTTSGMLGRFGQDVLQLKPNTVVIMGGTNDLWWAVSVETVLSQVMAMVANALHHQITPIVVIPFNIYPPNISVSWSSHVDLMRFQQEMERYQLALRESLALLEIQTVDLSKLFFVHGKDDSAQYLIDGLHPNEKGHLLMANKFLESIIL